MKKIITIAILGLGVSLAGCAQKIENPEMQQCAQQNYQCEANCELQSTGEGMVHKVCSTKCIDQYNQCKAKAEALGDVQ